MLFAGDEDLICNYKGIERLIGDLTWNGEQGMTVSRFLVQFRLITYQPPCRILQQKSGI